MYTETADKEKNKDKTDQVQYRLGLHLVSVKRNLIK